MKNIRVAVFLALPTLIWATIDIEVIASEDESERQIHVSGSSVDIISDTEQETFELYNEKLKNAVKDYFGEKPNYAFLKSPTPWNDLYKVYGWKQVHRVLKPLRAKLLSVKYTPTLILKQFFNNTSSKPATFDAHIRQDVEDTVVSIWQRYGELTTGINMSYGFEMIALAVSGKATMTYTSKWGENVMKSQSVTVGSETGLQITLQPNQRVRAELYATRGAMHIQIDYEASLDGSVAVNYADGYKGHFFYGLDIKRVMNAGGFNNSVLSSEVIVFNYYTDSEVVVRDYDTNDLLYYK